MKKYIRDMIDDLQRKKDKDFVPTIPPPSTGPATTDLGPTPEATLPDDLDNQELSKNPLERVRQLDFQAQESELEQEGE
ncbi:MAG: hypothetical protein ABSB35_28385 [Bryobacteraceae bacterium]|jgi:hypothetical protein